jgi:glutamine phosphoribosylpyrophosphate amidotransferase
MGYWPSKQARHSRLAGSLSVEEIRHSIGADSLGFISLEGLTEATTLPATSSALVAKSIP